MRARGRWRTKSGRDMHGEEREERKGKRGAEGGGESGDGRGESVETGVRGEKSDSEGEKLTL